MRIGVLLASLALALVSPGQERHQLPTRDGTPQSEFPIAEVHRVHGGARAGGCGFIRIDVTNPSRIPREIGFRMVTGWYDGFTVHETVQLEAGGSAVTFLPLYAVGMSGRLVADVGRNEIGLGGWIDTTGADGVHVGVLFVSDVRRAELGWEDSLVQRAGLESGTLGLTVLAPEDLPPRWSLLTGFDLIVVDGRSRTLDRTRQALLTDLLRSGDSVLLPFSDRLPEGPLRELAADSDVESRDVGLGRLLAVPGDSSANFPGGPMPASVQRALEEWLPSTGVGRGFQDPAQTVETGVRWGAIPATFGVPAMIAGLGSAPLRTFFLLLLAFAILVGPVNYIYWWRRRRLAMLVLTVPALGFGATFVMLLYGFASEGFGIRQTERSITVLDQERHEASCWAARSVYAGLAPGSLRPVSGTYMFAPGMFEAAQSDTGPRYRRAPDGEIDGALVPSRTVTSLPTATVARERARMRFRRVGEERFEVLASDELAPVSDEGAVVLCDGDGVCFVAEPDGTLVRVDRGAAEAVIAGMARRVGTTLAAPSLADDEYYYDGQGNAVPTGSDSRLMTRVVQLAELRPNTYVARVRRSPVFDELGLEIDERSGEHVVIGRLAAEDIVD